MPEESYFTSHTFLEAQSDLIEASHLETDLTFTVTHSPGKEILSIKSEAQVT